MKKLLLLAAFGLLASPAFAQNNDVSVTQTGPGNTATSTQFGADNEGTITQSKLGGLNGTGNDAVLYQTGVSNEASISQSLPGTSLANPGSKADVYQNGEDNDATVQQNEVKGDADIDQIDFPIIYTNAKDLMMFFGGDKAQAMSQVVSVEVTEGMQLIGFVTNCDISLGGQDDLIAVYFPFSYQVGGYLAYMQKSRCRPVDMPVQQAMQQVLTAHIKRPEPSKT